MKAAEKAQKREKLEAMLADESLSETVRDSIKAQLKAMEGKKNGKVFKKRNAPLQSEADDDD